MASIEKQEEELFEAARKLIDPKQRAAFVDAACVGNAELRRRLEELLAAQAEANAFFGKRPDIGAAPTELSAPVTEKPGDRIDRYKLLQKIGEGGCGVVYMAEQEEPVRRRVALKIVKLGMDTKSVIARFEAERQALAMMDHPNIAKVFDAGATETGRPYFVMELVRGIKITDYCDENKLSTRARLDLFIKVCQAIQHAHQKAIIHRDIKPSNILVTVNDGVPVPKVIDFGIAKATEGRLTDQTLFTAFEQFIGTPAYMSPEQAVMTSLDIDTRSDIYSLGVLLYELLTGKTPFDGKELVASGLDEMRRTIREKEPVRPSTRLSQTLVAADVRRLSSSNQKSEIISQKSDEASSRRLLRLKETIALLRGDLDWIVMKCLEKDRTRRYETANSLATDIRRHLNSEPVEARPPSQLYRLQKLARRNKATFAAAAAVAMALVLGIMVSTWQAIRATRAEREQTRQRENAQQAQANEARERHAAEEARRNEAQLRRKAEADELVARQRAYASDMNVAQQALAANNLGRAWDLLNRHRPMFGVPASAGSPTNGSDAGTGRLKAGLQTDLRGWEWRYLWQQGHSDTSFTLCQQTGWIWTLAVSHDGRWVAVGEQPSDNLSIWDLRSRQEIASLPAGETFVVAAFSPKEPLLAFSFVTDAKSPNSQFGVRLWNGAIRQIVAEFALGGRCNGMSFSDDGQRLIILEADPGNQLSVWRVPEGTKLASYGAAQRMNPGTPLALARGLSLAAHVKVGGGFRVVDLVTGEQRWEGTDVGFSRSLAFSPDAKVLASGHFGESEIRLWDVASGNMICRLEGFGIRVEALAFWPDGKTLASAGGDHGIRLWDLTDLTKVPPARILRGHRSEVRHLALAPDGTALVSGSIDGSVLCWDTATIPRELGPAILPERLHAWRFGSDNKSVLVVDIQGRVARWAGADFQEMQPLLQVGTNIMGACFSGDGRWAAVGLSNGIVQVADLQKRNVIGEFQAHSGPVRPLQFLSQGKKLVILHADDESLHEWDLTNWRWTRRLPSAPGPLGTPLRPAAFSPDERWCLTLGWDGASMVTDLTTGRPSSPNLDIFRATGAAYSPDGKLFAASSLNGYAKLWETETWREITPPLGGFLIGVISVAFSPDVQRLATGSSLVEAVKLWDLDSKQEVLTLEGQGASFRSTAFSPDGSLLGSMNSRGQLHLWRAPSWAEIEAAEKAQQTK